MQDKSIRVSNDAYMLLEQTKSKLKDKYQKSYSYSDIILSALPIFEFLTNEDSESVEKVIDAAKEARIKKRRGELPENENVIEKITVTAQDVIKEITTKKLGELVVMIIRTLLNSGHTASALLILMTYQHYIPEGELEELKTMTLEEIHRRILNENSDISETSQKIEFLKR